ncbi:MAG: glycerophosphodiester phosphodiesterase family protein [Methanomassiliicoccales archaeon]
MLEVRSNGRRPYLIGHRGDPCSAPENTLASFRRAIEVGCDAVEFDVHQSKDGGLVVMHDESMQRTAGLDKLIADLPLETIRAHEAGSWFDRRFYGEKIPLLEEALETITPHAVAVVEIKHGGDIYKGIEENVSSLVNRRREWVEKTIFIAFDPMVLQRIAETDPALCTGLLLADPIDDYLDVAEELGVDAFFPSWERLSEKTVHMAHKRGYSVHPWAIDDADNARKLADWGTDSLSSNKPAEIASVLMH